MAGLRHFLHRLLNVIRPDCAEASLEREVASHLLLLEDEYRRRGLSASEARRTARLALGGVERAKELHREARSFAWVDETRRDLQTCDVLSLVAWKGLKLAMAAVGIGSISALGATQLVSSLLYGFSGFEPIVLVVACLLLLLLALVASYLPARRASRLDPIVALRQP